MTANGLAIPPAEIQRLKVGDEVRANWGPVTRTDFVRYAGAGGDFNPIHHDEEFAIAAGMPSVFGMGLFHGGAAAAWVATWLGQPYLRRLRIRFTGQVWPGDTLTLIARVEAFDETESGCALTCSIEVRRQDGDPVIVGEACASERV